MRLILVLVLSVCMIGVTTHQPVFGHGDYTPPSPPKGLRGVAQRSLPSPGNFVNYETPHVHPLDISPDGTQLAVVNTPDGHVELFDIDGSGDITHREAIRVGMGPVSARWRTNTELWVVNQLSDSISIIDTTTSAVTTTLITYTLKDVGGLLKGSPNGDEPADVVFADIDSTASAIVSCSRTDIIQIYSLASLGSAPLEIYLDGEDPRALAVDTNNVYAAIFESGNSSTLVFGEDVSSTIAVPSNKAALNTTNWNDHPYYIDGLNELGDSSIKAINPPPNDGSTGPFTVAGGLGTYLTPAGAIGVNDMRTSTPVTTPPTTSIIVKKDFTDGDKWKDDNGADWTRYITGDRAAESGRATGWDMLDNDIATLSKSDHQNPTYVERRMNICMALGINPSSGNVYMVGTDATNEIRFEPNINGTFIRVMLSVTQPDGTNVDLIDLNEAHLDTAQGGADMAYMSGNVAQVHRDKSIGDPRGVTFNLSGNTVYISGMGSNNIIALKTSDHTRYAEGHTIEVGQGPTGIKHHPTLNRMYVVNKFSASVSVIDTTTAGSESVVDAVNYFDPTPDFINTGRVHFYGTHENSGLGQIACASCHIDGRMDRLSWDLGNPDVVADGIANDPNNADQFFAKILGYGDGLITGAVGTNPNDAINTLIGFGETEDDFGDFHPMKGPMTTQTLQDIIGKEPHHWRGDKDGIEEFAGAFDGLQGDDGPLNPSDMQEFEDFLSTIHFTPNPYRLLDNTLPGGPKADGGPNNPNLDMTGFFTAPPPGHPTLSLPGTKMESAVPSGGDAWNGYSLYVDESADNLFRCVDCHTLPIGAGSIKYMSIPDISPFSGFLDIPAGANGEAHQMVTSIDGTGQRHIKIPQTRNQLDKEGFFLNQRVDGNGVLMKSRAGFGVLHDGSIDGLVRFLSEPAFSDINTTSNTPPSGNSSTDDETVADIVSFTLAINGADFDYLKTLSGAPSSPIPPAANDQTAHAGTGHSLTISATPASSSNEEDAIYWMTRRAHSDKLGLVVVGKKSGERRGWVFDTGEDAAATFLSDRDGESVGIATLLSYAGASGAEMTFMMVPTVEEVRRGIDRDEDAVYDGDEAGFNTDTANPHDHKWVDANFVDTPEGSKSNPFVNVTEALAVITASAGKSSALHVNVGDYTTSVSTLDKPMKILAENGTVTIDLAGP